MKKIRLLIATTNPGKLEEITTFLSDVPITPVSLTDLDIKNSVKETGKTFEENAVKKARYYAKKSGLPTLADDGGFEIDALGGEPGIQSHRWVRGDRESTDDELIRYTMKRLKGVPLPQRGAQLRLVLALCIRGQVYTTEAHIRGVIPLQPSPNRTEGFPYRSILYLPELSKFYNAQDFTAEENDVFNHRKRAIEELKPVIRKLLVP